MGRAREIADLIGGTTPDIILKTSDGAILNLQTSDTTVAADGVLGAINFQAPDEASGTDSILIASKIEAIAEDTFAADNNKTKLVFSTGASAAASEKMSIASTGATTITTTGNEDSLTLVSSDADSNSGPHLVLDRQSSSPADSDFLGQVVFRGKNDAGETTDYATIRGFINDASDGTEDTDIDIISLTGGTSRNRLQIGATETIINNNGVDIDFRVESDGNANMLIVDAGLDAVLIGTNAEYSGTPAVLTVNKAMDVGDSSSSDNGTIAFARNAGTGTIGSLQSKIAGFGDMPKINFTATNVGGGSQTGELEFYTNLNASLTLNFKIAGNGDLTATDTSIGSISDERLKKEVEDFTYDLEKFKKLETKSFKWRNPILHGNRSDTVYGTIAQQIESVDADFVIEDELKATVSINEIEETNPDYTLTEDTKGVAKLSKVTGKKDAMYISVIQQLIAKVETLETKVSTLESG